MRTDKENAHDMGLIQKKNDREEVDGIEIIGKSGTKYHRESFIL